MDHMGEGFASHWTSQSSQRKYKLYLGTRYTGFLAFVFFFIYVDGGGVPCHVRLARHWFFLLRPLLTSTFLAADYDT
jgi:hypothetical protein